MIIINNKIYNAEKFMHDHPGGDIFIRMFQNKDATEADLWNYMYKTDHYIGMKKKNREANSLNLKEKSYANITLDYENLQLHELEKYFGVLDASHERLLHQ